MGIIWAGRILNHSLAIGTVAGLSLTCLIHVWRAFVSAPCLTTIRLRSRTR